jgi:hypothetical protein
MKYQLTIPERFIILNMLAKDNIRGDILTLKLVHEATMNVALDETEIKEKNIVREDDKYYWNDSTYEKEIEIPESVETIIINELKIMNDAKTLSRIHVPLWEKIVERKESDINKEEITGQLVENIPQ